jgi:hypothetical protein
MEPEGTLNQSLHRSEKVRIPSHLNMNLTNKILLFLLTFGTIIWASSDTHSVIVVKPTLPRAAKSILDLRIERIELSGVTMKAALEKIRDAIYESSGGKLMFSYGYRYARAAEFAQSGIPVEKWEMRDLSVNLQLKNATLREVLNRLCAQSGWSFSSFGDGIGFIDDNRYSAGHKAVVRGDESRASEVVAALEKYRRDRGSYPNRLSELVPAYIAAVKPPHYGVKKWEYVHYPKRNSFALFLRARNPSEESYWYNPLRQEFLPTTQRPRN